LAYAQRTQNDRLIGQAGLFDILEAQGPTQDKLDLEKFDDFDKKTKLEYEVELLGMYVSGHPLDEYRDLIKEITSMEIRAVQDIPLGKIDERGRSDRELQLACMIVGKKVLLTKKGDKMCFLTLEDLSGKMEGIIFPRVFQEFEKFLESTTPLLFMGKVNLVESPRKFIVNRIQEISEMADEKIKGVRIGVDLETLNTHVLSKFKQVIMSYRGSVPVELIFESKDGLAQMKLSEDYMVSPSPQMAAKLNEILQRNAVVFLTEGSNQTL